MFPENGEALARVVLAGPLPNVVRTTQKHCRCGYWYGDLHIEEEVSVDGVVITFAFQMRARPALQSGS